MLVHTKITRHITTKKTILVQVKPLVEPLKSEKKSQQEDLEAKD